MPATDVARAYGLAASSSELTLVARGAMGEVFRLETTEGPIAVKRLLWGPTGDEEANVAFQSAAADAGVSLARPLLTTNGDVLKRLPDGWWRAYEWVEGHQVSVGDRTPLEIAAAVVANLGRLHACKYDAGPHVDGWFLGVSDDEVERALGVAERAGIDVSGARRALPGLAAVSRMTPVADPIGCHNDPDRGNVIVRADASVVLIDWDNAGANYAEGEIAGALWLWSDGGDGDRDDAHVRAVVGAMVAAYRDAGGVFMPSGVEVFASVCSGWVNYTINCCDHLVDPSVAPETLAYERPVVDQLPIYPVTVESLERILEMVPA